jgi:glutathione synthase/RimK-type ligase-like ATP-grasp enzyme
MEEKQQRPLEIIGTTENIGFPELGVRRVPAKVDTGADSCSIWATDVRVDENGTLSYTLFGPGSRLYSGERLRTEEYRTRSVRNSFGVAEFRYKVQLQVQIGKRKIRSWFTLADRGEMRYPVLLGRRLLRNKFVVDVNEMHVHETGEKADSYNVLVMVHEVLPEYTGYFTGVAAKLHENANIVVRSYDQLTFWVSTGKVEVRETVTGGDLATYDLVYFKNHQQDYEFATAAAEYLQYNHVPFFDDELREHVSYDKLSESMRLALRNIPVPAMFCASSAFLAANAAAVVQSIGAPFVCKDIAADRGRSNYLLQNEHELAEVFEQSAAGQHFVLQSYVPNNGFIRALVLEPDVALAIKREPVANDNPRKMHLNQPHGSANAHLMHEKDVPPAVYDLAVRAAKFMNRQVAGVDLIQDKKTGVWYVLEVNNAPQIVGGAFIPEKQKAFAKFIDFQLGR